MVATRLLDFWGQEKRKRRVLQPSQEGAAAIGTPNDITDLTKRSKYPSCLTYLKSPSRKVSL
ncbi:hypothetical protein NC652_028749 [Populus alba x Populus x berolinensis]|nr:hypothetical protein NC652_028749 [Populus alba x Populus x berolinensis]